MSGQAQHDPALKVPFAQLLLSSARLSPLEAYRVMVVAGACTLRGGTEETRYRQTVQGHTAADLNMLARAFGQWMLDMQAAPFTDLLGPVYMALSSHGARQGRGEFYTPPHIAALMAGLLAPDLGVPARGRPLWAAEPCCGSGRMVLESARVWEAAGLPRHETRWVATELNSVQACAAYLNFTLNDVPAVVRCGNSLGDTFDWQWQTPAWDRATPGEPAGTAEPDEQSTQEQASG